MLSHVWSQASSSLSLSLTSRAQSHTQLFPCALSPSAPPTGPKVSAPVPAPSKECLHFITCIIALCLDDILIFSKSQGEHTQHLRAVLQRLIENFLFVSAEECEFHSPAVSFLGYLVAQGSVQVDLAKVSAVVDWPVPEIVAALPGVCDFLLPELLPKLHLSGRSTHQPD